MAEQNDHDLLVRLDTKVEMLIQSQNAFIQASNAQTKELGERVARLEIKDRGDSEKFQSISADVQRSLNNSQRIDTVTAEVDTLKDGIKNLQSKSNLWDIGNSVAVAIAAVIAWFSK
jgi:seryl-tRNA synthetase